MAEKKNEEVMELAPVETTVETTELAAEQPTVGGFATDIMTKVAVDGHFASFDTTTDEGKIDVFNAMNDAEVLTIGEILTVENIVIAPAQVRDQETGELKTLAAVTLITPGGGMYRSTSQGVVKTAINLLSTFGKDGRLTRTVNVVAKEIDLPGGRRYKKLSIVK